MSVSCDELQLLATKLEVVGDGNHVWGRFLDGKQIRRETFVEQSWAMIKGCGRNTLYWKLRFVGGG